MPISFNAPQIDQLKRDAKRLAGESGTSHSTALDQIALRHGFSNWSLLMKHSSSHPPQFADGVFRFRRTDDDWKVALQRLRGIRIGDAISTDAVEDVCSQFESILHAVVFSKDYVSSLLQQPQFKAERESPASVEMRCWLLYSVHAVTEGDHKRILLNRYYKPVGRTSRAFVNYEDFHTLHIWPMPEQLRMFSNLGGNSGYLYADSNAPWISREDAAAYVSRLECLERLLRARDDDISPSRKAVREEPERQSPTADIPDGQRPDVYQLLRPWARIPTWFTHHPTDERRLDEVTSELGTVFRGPPPIADLRAALARFQRESLGIWGDQASDRDLVRFEQKIMKALSRGA